MSLAASALRLACAGAALWLVAAPAPVAAPRTWAEDAANLAGGSSDGVAVSARGVLFLAPAIDRLADGPLPGQPQQVLAMAADRAGNILLGTGPDGRVIKITPAGACTTLFVADEPLVTALAVTPGGEILAGTAPGGTIYRIRPEGGGAAWSETGERYVWALVVGADGTVWAATGERGRVLRIDRAGAAETFFDSDEPHVVSLAESGAGLVAGGAGRALLYRIDAEGHAVVGFDGGLPELTALAPAPGGDIVAALLAPPEREETRPAFEIRLPDGTQVGTTDENVDALETRRGPVLRGTIEDLPTRAEPGPPRLRGRLVRVSPDGEGSELWRSGSEAPFCVVRDDRGRVLFGTGEPARLYRVEADGDAALLGTLDEAQVTGLLRIGRSLFLATSNPATVYRVEERQSESGVFTSRPFDAGAVARWGAVRWRVDGGPGRVEIYTRTGNCPNPDATWSAWSPAMIDPESSRVPNPDGRFFQWRARLIGAQDGGPRLSALRVVYETYNRPPRLREFRAAQKREAYSSDAVFAWVAADPDGDPLEIRLERRDASGGEWVTAVRATAAGAPEGSGEQGGAWVEGRLTWDTRNTEEGSYELRAVASDRAVNDPAEGREDVVTLALPVTVDRTAPELRVRALEGRQFEVTLTDSLSAVRGLELLRDGVPLHAPRPIDGLCDSRQESFRFDLPVEEGGWAVRGADAAGNSAEQALTPP